MRWGLDELSSTHAPHQPVRPTLVPRVTPTRVNVANVVGPEPTAFHGGPIMSKGNDEVVSVKIVPNDSGNLQRKLADAEVVFEAGSGPLYGLRLIGFGVWELSDGGRNVTFSGAAVLRERRTPQLRAVAPRQRRGQRAGRDSAVHPRRVHPRRDHALNGPFVLPRRSGSVPRRLEPRSSQTRHRRPFAGIGPRPSRHD